MNRRPLEAVARRGAALMFSSLILGGFSAGAICGATIRDSIAGGVLAFGLCCIVAAGWIVACLAGYAAGEHNARGGGASE